MENRKVEITIEQKAHAMMLPGMGPGGDSMDFDFQGMLEKDPAQERVAAADDRGRGPPRAASSRNARR